MAAIEAGGGGLLDPAGPVRPEERIELLDILRGFAIFGILVVNLLYFSQPLAWVIDSPFDEPWNRIASALITFLFTGKFYTIFSILFGVGFAIQLARGERRGMSAVPLHARRLFVLLLIGVAHASLLWFGDILHTYAILGFLLIPFRRARGGTLLAVAAVSLLLPIALAFLGALVVAMVPGALDGGATLDEQLRTAEALRNYASGSWSAITEQRILDWLMLDALSLTFLPNIFAMFLVGFWAGRAGIHERLAGMRGEIRLLLAAALPVGIAGNAVVVASRHTGDPTVPSWMGAFGQLAYAIGVPALSLSYIAILVLVVTRPEGAGPLGHLAPVGRMALTNYLLQSVVGTLTFYGYGLGWYGRVGPWIAVPMAVALFALQIPFSRWWLARFRFGPVEWLWRSATYGRPQPMRSSPGAS